MFVYGLIDPRDGCLRYVGQTKNPRERAWGHVGMARFQKSRCASWILGLRKLDLRPRLEILEELPVQLVDDAERFWIASLRAAGARLLNMSDGGDGSPGSPRPGVTARLKGVAKSEETRQRMKAAKTSAVRKAVSEFHHGRKRSEETRKKMSLWQKGKPQTEAQLAALARAHAAVRKKAGLL